MPLTSEAKKEYQRVYMRKTRHAIAKARQQALAVGKRLSGAALTSVAGSNVAQEMLRDALDQHGLKIGLTLNTVKGLHEAERPYGKEAVPGPDNDARARACDLAIRLHERAGTIPVKPQEETPNRSGRVVLVQIDANGTERRIEIG